MSQFQRISSSLVFTADEFNIFLLHFFVGLTNASLLIAVH